MILCTHCGKQNKKESKFCSFCGDPLDAESCIVGRLLYLDDASREHLLAAAERSIGRAPDNDIVLDDSEVSSRHARIWYAVPGFCVEDLKSRNGTFLNGHRITAPTPIKDDDLLKMGRTLLRFKL